MDKNQRHDQGAQGTGRAQSEIHQGVLARRPSGAKKLDRCQPLGHEFRIRSNTFAVIRCARGSGPRGVV